MENGHGRSRPPAPTRRSDPIGYVHLRGAERRVYRRGTISAPATLKIHGENFSVELVDISVGGAQIRCSVVPAAGADIIIEVHGVGTLPATVIRRSLSHIIAVEFNLDDELREKFSAKLETLIMAAPGP